MKSFLLLVGSILLFSVAQAQDVPIYGNYYVGVPDEHNMISLEQNCWTMEIDEVILGAAEYDEYEVELIFNGFHSANLMGKLLESSPTMLRFSVHDPDMEDAQYETYSFIRISDGRWMLRNETTELSTILVPTSDKDKYTYIPCSEETPVNKSEGEE